MQLKHFIEQKKGLEQAIKRYNELGLPDRRSFRTLAYEM